MELSDSPGRSNSKKQRKSKRVEFSKSQKNHVLAAQNNLCAGTHCGNSQLDPRATKYHHIIPYNDGGPTSIENCEALCSNCHDKRTNDLNVKQMEEKRLVGKKPTIADGSVFTDFCGKFGRVVDY